MPSPTEFPRHVVLVPDGNRRWAKRKKLPSFFGHRAGARSAEVVLKAALKTPIAYLTLWICSVGNLTDRSATEVRFLYEVFTRAFKRFQNGLGDLEKEGVRIRVLGRWEEFFPKKLADVVRKLEHDTASFGPRTLTFLAAYDGRDEMLAAVRGIAKEKLVPRRIGADALKQHLWTKDLPPVDLVIRTGGEPHWSAGLLMWDVAEAQLYFTETLWPDFGSKELDKALARYAATERRHGK